MDSRELSVLGVEDRWKIDKCFPLPSRNLSVFSIGCLELFFIPFSWFIGCSLRHFSYHRDLLWVAYPPLRPHFSVWLSYPSTGRRHLTRYNSGHFGRCI